MAVIYTICVDPENGKYCAFFSDSPKVRAVAYSRAEAIVELMEKHGEEIVNLDEIKKRDHRNLNKTLELFTMCDEVGPGLPLWLPNGTVIKEELEKWGKETEDKWGYKWIKWVTKIELSDNPDYKGYWEQGGYSNDGSLDKPFTQESLVAALRAGGGK